MLNRLRTVLLGAMIAAGAGLIVSPSAKAQPADFANYAEVATGLGDVLYAVSPPGEPTRLMIVQRNGVIRVMDNGVLQAGAFLNVGSTTVNGQAGLNRLVPSSGSVVISGTTYNIQRYNEQGLLGLAFAPDYATSRRFYINYNAPRGAYQLIATGVVSDVGRTVVARMTTSANPNVANTAEERILQIDQPYVNHNGGCMNFGSDGFLYIAMGDGGSGGDPGNRAQDCRASVSGSNNTNSWFGKMLRIDVSGATGYTVPNSNPFIGQTQLGEPIRPEIYNYGLRNPWRWSFDRLTGDMWIADVGQDVWEEVNFNPAPNAGAGLNYGWKAREGLVAYGSGSAAPFSVVNPVQPVYVYPHTTQAGYTSTRIGFSVTGGFVYRGNKIPAWRGRYFFADYVTARVWSFRIIEGVMTDFIDHASALTGPTPAISGISSFGEDADGEILICMLSGRVRRIVPQTLLASVNPCDIADSTGRIAPDGSVNEGDYNAFFMRFFGASYIEMWPCDIADSAGRVAEQYVGGFAGGGPDGSVNEGDYNAFFIFFFN